MIRLRRAGDILLTAPVARDLRAAFPDATLDFLAFPAGLDVVAGHPALDGVRAYDRDRPVAELRAVRGRYDWILDFQSSPRTAWLSALAGAAVTVGWRVRGWGRLYRVAVPRRSSPRIYAVAEMQRLAAALGVPTGARLPEWWVRPEEARWAAAAFEAMGIGGDTCVLAMAPFSANPLREWRAEAFAEVARRAGEIGADRVLVLWGPGERVRAEAIARVAGPNCRLAPASTVRQLAALIARCYALVGSDSAPGHLAVALGVPRVTVYGPTDPEVWSPPLATARVVRAHGLPCLGCELSRCPVGHLCMRLVSPKDVLEALGELFAAQSGRRSESAGPEVRSGPG